MTEAELDGLVLAAMAELSRKWEWINGHQICRVVFPQHTRATAWKKIKPRLKHMEKMRTVWFRVGPECRHEWSLTPVREPEISAAEGARSWLSERARIEQERAENA